MMKFTVILFGTWQFGKIDVLANKICNIEKFTFFSVFLVRGKSEKIESIHFADRSRDSTAKRNLSKEM